MARDRQATLRTIAYHGPILAVEDLKDHTQMTIAVGMGPYVHFTQGEGTRVTCTKQLFTNEHIHGIRLCDDDTLIAWASTLIVFGKIQRDSSSGRITGFAQSNVIECEDWVLSALFVEGDIYVSTMHNELVVIDATSGLIKERLQAPSRAILYSSHVACLGRNKEDIVVVGGSVRWTCPVWCPYGFSQFREVEVHQGSVFSVRVYTDSTDGPLVLSSSDDRTAVLWRLTDGAVLKTYAQGHGGRVWVALLCQEGVLTACEDAVVRLFDRKTANCLKEFHGHRHGGHGVRALVVSYLKGTPYAVSGGEDASVKTWDLAKELEARSTTLKLPPTGDVRKDWIRWVGFLDKTPTVRVVSNFGRIYTCEGSKVKFECEVEGAPVVVAALSKSFLWLGLVSGGVIVADRHALREQHAFQRVIMQQPSSIFTDTYDDIAVITNRLGNVSVVSASEGVQREYKVAGKKTCCCAVDDHFLLGTAGGAIWVLPKTGSTAPSESRLFGNKVKVVSIRVTTAAEGKRQVVCSGNDGVLVTASWNTSEDGRITLQPIYSIRVSAVQHLLGVHRPTPKASSRLAWGFTETSFVVWDVDNLVERWKVDCGGQRRPYDFAFNDGEATLVYGDTTNWAFALVRVDGTSWITEDCQFGGDHGRTVHGVCAIGDRSFATCSEDNSVKVYTPSRVDDGEVTDWRCTQTLDLHIGPVKCIASCGEFVVSGGARSQWFLYRAITDEDGRLSLWVENGGVMMPDQEGVESFRIMAADIMLDSGVPLVIFGDSAGNVWSGHGEPKSLQFSSTYHRNSACLAVICRPSETDWPSVAGYADGNLVRLDDRKCLPVHAAGINALSWTSKGYLVTGGDDQDLFISDMKRMIVLNRISLAHLAGIHSLVASKVLGKECEEIYSLGWDRRIKTWTLPQQLCSSDEDELCYEQCTHSIVTEPNDVTLLSDCLVLVGRGWQALRYQN